MLNSPWLFVSRMVISVFCAETFVMLLFLLLPDIPQLVEVFLDSTLLSILISPALYFFLYRPLNQQFKKCLLIERELRQSGADLKQKAQALEETMKKLQLAPQLLHAEKMSSLGRLVSGIAHEINNPVNFIYGNLKYATEYTYLILQIIQKYQDYYPNPPQEIKKLIKENELDFLTQDLTKILSSMTVGTERITEIVKSLRNFSRLDEAEIKQVHIHEGIDSTLMILEHRFQPTNKYPEIQVIQEYGQLPLIECYPGQLNQVFMNILTNAIDALQDVSKTWFIGDNQLEKSNYLLPTIRICTEVIDQEWVAISIADNGYGMNEEVRARLFDPFFTTKPVGKGTGLGLSISYQIIVEKHHGQLRCISVPGQGTEFVIQIPVKVKYENLSRA